MDNILERLSTEKNGLIEQVKIFLSSNQTICHNPNNKLSFIFYKLNILFQLFTNYLQEHKIVHSSWEIVKGHKPL